MLDECVCLNLRKATRGVTRLYDDALRPVGIRSTQLPFLVAVSLREQTVTTLAAELALDRTTLSRNLAVLERRGWLQVSSGDDRRTKEIRLTKGGRDVLERAIPLWERAQAEAAGTLDAWWLKQLLKELGAAMGAAPGP